MRIAQSPRSLIIGCFAVSALALPQIGSAQTKPAMTDPAKAPIAAAGIDEVYQLVDAVVTKVDSKTRTVTLKDKDGTFTNFVAGPEIKNFPQIKVGDRLTVTHELAVAIELVKVNNQGVRSEVQTSTQTSAALGSKPASMMSERFFNAASSRLCASILLRFLATPARTTSPLAPKPSSSIINAFLIDNVSR